EKQQHLCKSNQNSTLLDHQYFICDPPLKDSYGFIIPIVTTKNLNLAKSKPLVSKSATLSSVCDPFFDDTADQDAAVTPNLERKSDETEEVNIEEKEASNVKSGDTEELDLETTQSTARQGTITPRILNFEEEVNIEEKEASNVKSGDTEELDLETTQSTARQGTITPRILNFEEEAGPSSPLRPIQVMDSEERFEHSGSHTISTSTANSRY
ncbi:hypothetical protein Tco_1248380, partial [Tanacetum coccineum]